jgi:hypothetical protein
VPTDWCAPAAGGSWHILGVPSLAKLLRAGRVAVLRGDDQRAGRSPRRCVKTGVPTDGATRVRAVALERADVLQVLVGYGLTRLVATVLRRPSLEVVLAVSPLAWRRWQRALLVPVVIGAAGAALVAFGAGTGAVAAVVIGALLIAGSWVVRGRAVVRSWVGIRFRSAQDEVVVTRASAGFDEDARRLFARSVLR